MQKKTLDKMSAKTSLQKNLDPGLKQASLCRHIIPSSG